MEKRLNVSGDDDGDVRGWRFEDPFIVPIRLDIASYISSRLYRLMWREVGGTFSNLDSIGDLTFNADTILENGNSLTITDHICSDHLTYTWSNGVEVEGAGAGTIDSINADSYTEIQFAVECSGASYGTEYEFQLYDATLSTIIGTCGATISELAAGWELGALEYRLARGRASEGQT